jgi:hypothetical protein
MNFKDEKLLRNLADLFFVLGLITGVICFISVIATAPTLVSLVPALVTFVFSVLIGLLIRQFLRVICNISISSKLILRENEKMQEQNETGTKPRAQEDWQEAGF